MRKTLCVAVLFVVVGCGDDDADPPAPGADTVADVTPPDDPDPGPEGDTETPIVAPSFDPAPFKVGVSRMRFPVPVGMGTAGFGSIDLGGGGDMPKSRFADKYPATRGVYTHPSMHTVAIEGAPDTVVLMRLDVIGVPQDIRQAIIERVIERGGPDLTRGLVIGATHTHSGPGRVKDNDLWAAITDSFFPEFYVRVVEAGADSVLAALDDLEPARFGHTLITTSDMHNDRRCQSPELLDGSLPILRFDRADGTLKALVMTYSAHGTVIGSDEYLLSRDFHGGVELKIEEQFDHPITALFFNSWSGDTSPKRANTDEHFGANPSFGQIEGTANVAAEHVAAAVDAIEMSDEMVVRSNSWRVPLNREALGYDEEVFLYDWGAVYCGAGVEEICWEEIESGTKEPPAKHLMTTSCIPFPETLPAPLDTVVGMFQLADAYVVTVPGEPATSLGIQTISNIKEQTAAKNIYMLGYAQDYIGYSLPEDDWYLGGYEASGSLWGPKQGDYVDARCLDFARHFVDGVPLPFDSLPAPPVKQYDTQPFPVEPNAGDPAVIQQPTPTYPHGDVVTIVINGGDPWLLSPTVTLERQQEDGAFAPHTRKNGTPVSTDGYEFELTVAVTPTYEDAEGPIERAFAWTIHFPTRRAYPATTAPIAGQTLRLRVQGLTDHDAPFDLTTDPFTVAQ